MNSLTKEQGKSVGYLIQRVAVSRALFLSSSLFFFGGGWVGRWCVCTSGRALCLVPWYLPCNVFFKCDDGRADSSLWLRLWSRK